MSIYKKIINFAVDFLKHTKNHWSGSSAGTNNGAASTGTSKSAGKDSGFLYYTERHRAYQARQQAKDINTRHIRNHWIHGTYNDYNMEQQR